MSTASAAYVWLMAGFLSPASYADPNQPPPSFADVPRMVARKLEMRDSYTLRLRFESRDLSSPAAPTRRAYTVEMWRAGDRFRIDLFDAESTPFQDGTPGQGSRHVTCTNCERRGYILMTTVYPGRPAVTNLVEFQTSADMSPRYSTLSIDWRFLGLCNTQLSAYRKVPIAKGYQDLAADPGLKLSRQPRDGTPCLVTTVDQSDRRSDIWFSETDGDNPVLHVWAGNLGRGPGRTTTEVAWRPTPGGHRYPSRVRHTVAVKGAVEYEEILTVERADFHSPVDPKVFTLAGLGLNENQRIAFPDVPSEDQPRWRDGKADPSLSERAKARAADAPAVQPAAMPTAPYPDVGGNTSLVVAVASGAVAVAAFAVAVARRRRGGV